MAPRAFTREPVRIEAEHIFTRDDSLRALLFPEAIYHAFNSVDVHSEQLGCQGQLLQDEEPAPKVLMRAFTLEGSTFITIAGQILSADRTLNAGIRSPCARMTVARALGTAALDVERGMHSGDIDRRDVSAVALQDGAAAVLTQCAVSGVYEP